jgi:hypothetical protein
MHRLSPAQAAVIRPPVTILIHAITQFYGCGENGRIGVVAIACFNADPIAVPIRLVEIARIVIFHTTGTGGENQQQWHEPAHHIEPARCGWLLL